MQCDCVSKILEHKRVKLNDMSHGSLGYDENGNVWYRTMSAIICLNDCGNTFSGNGQSFNKVAPDSEYCYLFNPGETVTLTQK